MYTFTSTYTNFNGVEVTKKFYFNLTKAEIALREMESDNTFAATLMAIRESDQGSVVLPEFKKIVKWTYGVKSDDGEDFIKNDEVWNAFENSEPWSQLIMKLLTEPDFTQAFMTGVLPPDLNARAQEANAVNGFRPGADTSRPTPPNTPVPGGVPVTTQPPVQTPTPTQDAPQFYQDPPQFYQNPVIEQNVQRTSEPRQSPYDGQQ